MMAAGQAAAGKMLCRRDADNERFSSRQQVPVERYKHIRCCMLNCTQQRCIISWFARCGESGDRLHTAMVAAVVQTVHVKGWPASIFLAALPAPRRGLQLGPSTCDGKLEIATIVQHSRFHILCRLFEGAVQWIWLMSVSDVLYLNLDSNKYTYYL